MRFQFCVNVLDWDTQVSEFEPYYRYYIHFRNNTFGKGMNLFNPSAMGWIVPVLFFYKDNFGIK